MPGVSPLVTLISLREISHTATSGTATNGTVTSGSVTNSSTGAAALVCVCAPSTVLPYAVDSGAERWILVQSGGFRCDVVCAIYEYGRVR